MISLSELIARYRRPDGTLPPDVRDQLYGMRALVRRERIEAYCGEGIHAHSTPLGKGEPGRGRPFTLPRRNESE